jgi:hypothetical protein
VLTGSLDLTAAEDLVAESQSSVKAIRQGSLFHYNAIQDIFSAKRQRDTKGKQSNEEAFHI